MKIKKEIVNINLDVKVDGENLGKNDDYLNIECCASCRFHHVCKDIDIDKDFKKSIDEKIKCGKWEWHKYKIAEAGNTSEL